MTGAPVTEDQIFDANRTTPVRLLRDLYEKNRFLILGIPYHEYGTQYEILDSLLRAIGPDPRLKFIVLERSYEDAPILEEGSTTDLSTAMLISRFGSEQRARASLCMSSEWAYTWSDFLPRMRAFNARRPAGHKVLVTSFDGVEMSKTVGLGMFEVLRLVEGEHRESTTSVRFWNGMWKHLGPSDKVIMVYHVAHVIKTFTVLEQGQRVPSDWMGFFLRDHPEAESKIGVVLLDQNPPEGDSTTASLLKFTRRQASRYPGQAFAVRLAPFHGALSGDIVSDTGMIVFAEEPLLPFGSDSRSDRTLPDMLDGVVWLPQTRQWVLQPPPHYLPLCAGYRGH